MRRLLICACLAAPASLPAAAPAHGPDHDGRHAEAASASASVALTRCRAPARGSDRWASFRARMAAVPGTRRMVMRFTLFERTGSRRFEPVDAPGLRVWRRSRVGVDVFAYNQTVTGLRRGSTYRMRVDFRWVDTGGRTIARAVRSSADCRQPGSPPNLRTGRIESRPGPTDGTSVYRVEVMNVGGSSAEHVGVVLFVDGANVDAAELDGLRPYERRTVEFVGPSCESRVRAVVDPEDDVPESSERDNSRARSCADASGTGGQLGTGLRALSGGW